MYSDVFSMYRAIYIEALFLFSMYRSLYIEYRELAVAFSLGAIEAPLLAIEGTSLYIEYGESASMYSAPGSMYAQSASMHRGLRMARAAGWASRKGLPVGEKSSRASGRLSRRAGSETGMDGADGDIESPRRWIMDRRELLLSPLAYMPPPQLLAGLEPDDAARVAPGTPHSIVRVVAHLVFWQSWFLDRCAGVARPLVAKASEGWPPADADDWETLRAQFLDGLQRAVEWPGDGPVAPAIELPTLAHYTITDALTHVAVHNAHHLGQVVTLRQILGVWPPPEGSWTW